MWVYINQARLNRAAPGGLRRRARGRASGTARAAKAWEFAYPACVYAWGRRVIGVHGDEFDTMGSIHDFDGFTMTMQTRLEVQCVAGLGQERVAPTAIRP